MKFVPVKPEEIPNFREAHRGRVSYPICKMFLESNTPVAKFDRSGMDKSVGSLKALLQWYIRGHKLPIKLVTRQGELYFIRLDMDEQGNKNSEWKWQDETPDPDEDDVPSLDGAAIAQHQLNKK